MAAGPAPSALLRQRTSAAEVTRRSAARKTDSAAQAVLESIDFQSEAQYRADAAWEQQMQERLRQDSLARQSYEDSTAAQQYQDALAQQQFDNDVTSQKLAIAQGEWALKRSQAQQEAAAASARAAGRASGGSSAKSTDRSGGASSAGSLGSSGGGTAGSGSSGIDYQQFARQMRTRGYTIDEIKAMFDAMRGV